jgi:hypothetical protein
MGIKNEVEDLGAVFKKMAILKPAAEKEDKAILVELEDTEIPAKSLPETSVAITDQPAQSAEDDEVFLPTADLFSLVHYASKSVRTAKRKTAIFCEGQVSLFDFVEQAIA